MFGRGRGRGRNFGTRGGLVAGTRTINDRFSQFGGNLGVNPTRRAVSISRGSETRFNRLMQQRSGRGRKVNTSLQGVTKTTRQSTFQSRRGGRVVNNRPSRFLSRPTNNRGGKVLRGSKRGGMKRGRGGLKKKSTSSYR